MSSLPLKNYMIFSLLLSSATPVDLSSVLLDYVIKQEYVQYNYEEEIIDYVSGLRNIGYRRWCYWQKWCYNTYDCSGLIYSFLVKNNIPTKRKFNSTELYRMWTKKSVYDVQRWDLVYFQWINWSTNHIAIALGSYNDGEIYIVDNVSKRKFGKNIRTLKIYWQWEKKYYKVWDQTWAIYVSSNSVAEAHEAYHNWEEHPILQSSS